MLSAIRQPRAFAVGVAGRLDRVDDIRGVGSLVRTATIPHVSTDHVQACQGSRVEKVGLPPAVAENVQASHECVDSSRREKGSSLDVRMLLQIWHT